MLGATAEYSAASMGCLAVNLTPCMLHQSNISLSPSSCHHDAMLHDSARSAPCLSPPAAWHMHPWRMPSLRMCCGVAQHPSRPRQLHTQTELQVVSKKICRVRSLNPAGRPLPTATRCSWSCDNDAAVAWVTAGQLSHGRQSHANMPGFCTLLRCSKAELVWTSKPAHDPATWPQMRSSSQSLARDDNPQPKISSGTHTTQSMSTT